MYEKIFTKGRINGCTIRNRIALAPMDDCLGQASGEITKRSIEYYAAKAKGGVGLIIIGYVGVDGPEMGGVAMSGQTFLCNMDQRHAMSNAAERIHEYGAKVFVQLNHPGRKTMPKFNQGYEALSATALPTQLGRRGFRACREMTVEQIHRVEDDFAAAAEHAYMAGVDGVEIHCAHWYLMHQFISPVRNERTDEYGGSMENRCRIVTETIEKIRKKVPASFPVTVRMHFFDDEGFEGDLTIDDYIAITRHMEANGVDAVHFSIGTEDRTGAPEMEAGWRNEYYKRFKEALQIPIYGPNEVKTPEEAERFLEEGVYDFVIMGRPSSADPEWCNKAKSDRGKDIRPCINCNYCVHHVTADESQIRCAVNPTLGREVDALIPPEKGEGTVIVIGAGPGGIQAALTLADRGFHVELYDRRAELGGTLNLANKAPGKFRMDMLIEWYARQVSQNANIEVHLNTEITVERLDEFKARRPYAVILATGGKPIVPRKIPGVEKGISCFDILNGIVNLTGKHIAVIGGGMSGLETAERLVAEGNRVTLIEMAPILGNGVYFYNVRKTRRSLEAAGTVIKTGTALQEIRDGSIVVAPNEESFISSTLNGVANIAGVEDKRDDNIADGPYEIAADATVLALGIAPDLSMLDELEARFERVVELGDCCKPGRISDATAPAYWRMRNL